MKRLGSAFYALCLIMAIEVPFTAPWALRLMVLLLVVSNALLWSAFQGAERVS